MSAKAAFSLIVFFLASVAGCSAEPEPTAIPAITPVPTWTSTPVVQVQNAAQATPEPSNTKTYDSSSSSALERLLGLQPTENVAKWSQEFLEAELKAGFLDEEGLNAVAELYFPAMFDVLQGPCKGNLDDLGRTLRYYFENPIAIQKYVEIESAFEFPSGYLPYMFLMMFVSYTIEQESNLKANDDVKGIPSDSFDCDQILRGMEVEDIKAMVGQMEEKLRALEEKYR